jgi:arylsulfatase A-like enzyme
MLLVALLCAACNRGETPVFDFVAQFPSAEVQTPTTAIDFGTPAARAHFIDGWSGDELFPSGVSAVWGMGDHSSLRIFVAPRAPMTLGLRCWPLSFPQGPAQVMRVAVNGQQLTTLELTKGAADYTVEVPVDALVAGENELRFSYGYARRPLDVLAGATDPRPLAVDWDRLDIRGTPAAIAPAVQNGTDTPVLVIPFRTRVDYYLDVPPDSALSIERIAPWGLPDGGSNGTVLRIDVRTDGSATAQTFDLPASASPSRVVLPFRGQQVARLTFQAIPGTGAGSEGTGLQLIRPTLRARQAPQATEESDCRRQRPADAHPRPNVIVYLIDTLRADHLGCYGYARGTSPHIDAFAGAATVFANAVAQSSWTRSAVASIFTGLTPRVHGANGRTDVLRPTLTLAGLAQRAGYETAAIVTNSNVAPLFGMAQGFDTYKMLPERTGSEEIHQLSDRLNEEALAWLDQRSKDRPFLLYLHATDPHSPYTPRSPYRERFAGNADPHAGSHDTLQALLDGKIEATEELKQEMISLYDGEIAFVDAQFGALLERLKELGLYESALIILVADHGEAFNDHGRWEHGTSLFTEEVSVPLIVKFPNQWHAGERITARAQQVDILPTIVDYLGQDIPATVQGRSLLPSLSCSAPLHDQHPWYAYLGGDGFGIATESFTHDQLKLIHHLRADRPGAEYELYDLGSDPREEHDLSRQRWVAAGYLRSLLRSFATGSGPAATAPTAVMDEGLKERLRALGYQR